MVGMSVDKLRLGTAPDSWGVWHPQDRVQVPWDRFLDEVVQPVRRGAMVEPPNGIPAMPPVLAALGELDRDLFAIVEQDLYAAGGA